MKLKTFVWTLARRGDISAPGTVPAANDEANSTGHRTLWMYVVAAVLAALPFAFVALSPIHLLDTVIGEDGVVEYLGALAWLGGAVGFATAAAARWRAKVSGGVVWLAGLALMCSLAAGEEISWGQRIFGYGTPAFVAESNLQREMNFHNLTLLDTRQSTDGEQKSGLSRWLTFNRIGSLIWLGYLVALPLAVRFSRPFGRIADWMRLPSPPPWIATMGAATYLAFVAGVRTLDETSEHSHLRRVGANEIKESMVGLLFCLAAWSIYRYSAAPGTTRRRSDCDRSKARDSR